MTNPLAEPARVAFAGDWHMNTNWATSAIDYAAERDVDTIVHVGDFGYTFDDRYLDDLEDALRSPITAYGEMPPLHLLFIDGNHECFPKLHEFPMQENGLRKLRDHIHHLPRGFRWEWRDVKYLALGGAHSVDQKWRMPYVSWWPEEVISFADAIETMNDGLTDVLISHDCPAGVPKLDERLALNLGNFPEDELDKAAAHQRLLRSVVEEVKPKRIIHGHYHWRYDDVADFGYGPVEVSGLSFDDRKLEDNLLIVDL